MNLKQVIEEETERSPFYSRGQLFTFHISFAHNLLSLYISYFIRIQPVFTLHFMFYLHTTCVHFIICISFAHTLFSLYISHFIRINLFSLLFLISFTYTLFSLNISCILQPLFDVLLGMLGSAYSCSAVKGTCKHLIDIISHSDTKEL